MLQYVTVQLPLRNQVRSQRLANSRRSRTVDHVIGKKGTQAIHIKLSRTCNREIDKNVEIDTESLL